MLRTPVKSGCNGRCESQIEGLVFAGKNLSESKIFV
jgi:hypothetical protein